MALPPALTDPSEAGGTVFIATGDLALTKTPRRVQKALDQAIASALARVHPGEVHGQALIKVHIGEPSCNTRMRPAHVVGSVLFLEQRGASGVVAGDTTVAYTGPRGHRRNPGGDATAYMELAEQHGWSPDGPAGVPFVVLDRPSTAQPDAFPFTAKEVCREVDGVERFSDFYPAGGFDAADFVVNQAHLTLHGLAGVAGCVKSLAMGCSSLTGKLRMHQFLYPCFDEERCVLCGRCVENCPEDALTIQEGDPVPQVDKQRCIGCGECVSICATGKDAVTLEGERIKDWGRGSDTLAERMTDYVIGLMNGKWSTTLHVLHLYTVTKLCDCVDQAQTPMVGRDLGFLVGTNPFAMDLAAARLLEEGLRQEGRHVPDTVPQSAEDAAAYARETYGILTETSLERMTIA
jgi:hypothetical protein